MTTTAKTKRIVDELGELEGYEYRGVFITRNDSTHGVTRKFEIGTFMRGHGFDTLGDAKAHIDRKATHTRSSCDGQDSLRILP